MARRLEQLALVVLLVELPLVVLWAIDRVDIGPVLLYLGPRHGIHESDLVVIGLAAPTWWLLLSRLERTRRPRQ